jgi:hypothetical protein
MGDRSKLDFPATFPHIDGLEETPNPFTTGTDMPSTYAP